MKKTLYSLIIVSFVFGLLAITAVKADETTTATATSETAVTVSADAPAIPEGTVINPAPTSTPPARKLDINNISDLEKILSPDQIKNFQVMKRVGNTLYGIRKGTTTISVVATSTPGANNKLEKIAAPALINLYEKIQKIGTALWGIRKKATSTPPALIVEPEIASCVAKAIDVKDKALMTRVTAAAVELNSALSVRSACQQDAVIASSSPREAVNACVKTFQASQKTIRDTSKTLQKEVWDTYKESLKACRTAATSTSPVPMIEDGGNLFE